MTGATGRLGRALRRIEGGRVGLLEAVSPRAADGNVLDIVAEAAVDDFVARWRPRVILHLASLVGAACEADPEAAERVNVDGTAHLAAAARRYGVKRFVFVSTAAVYGDARRRPVAESDSTPGAGVYAATKLRAERLLAESAVDVPTDVLRVFNVYGPQMRDSLVSRLLGASPDRPVRLNGLDGFVRDYVHVDDVARALLAAAGSTETGFRVLNVGSGIPRSNRDLLDSLPGIRHDAVEIGPELDSYSCADIAAITTRLGWHPVETWPPGDAGD